MRSFALITAVAGAYALLRGWPGGPAPLLRSCLAVAALAAGLAFWGGRRKSSPPRPRMASLRRATPLDYLGLGAAVVFIEACFVVFTSSLAGPAGDVALALRERAGAAGPGQDGGARHGNTPGSPDFDGQRSGPWIFKPNLERDLPKQSNHKPGNNPEVFVELENAADTKALLATRIHLRAFAFSRFNGSAWMAAPAPRTQLLAPIRFPAPAEPPPPRPAVRHRVYHGVNPTGQNVFTALQGARSTDVSELTRLAESVYLLPAARDAKSGYSYTAASTPVHLADLAGQAVSPADAAPEELALPDFLAERLRQTAAAIGTGQDTASRLAALRAYLRENYQYSLETANADDSNALENFLYREKRGYCEHFATAAALLCRAFGVPSRIAYGWSGGRLYPGQNMFVFRAKDAHAWTEIKIRGHGWVVFDTTPPDDDAVPETRTAPQGETAPDPAEALAAAQAGDDPANTDSTPDTRAGASRAAMATVLAALCLCTLGFLSARRWKRPAATPDGLPLPRPQPGYLLHFKQASAALGHPMPVGRTLRQQIAALDKARLTPRFAGQLLDYHYQLLYGDNVQNPSTEKQLNRSIRSWRKKHTP